MTIVVGAGTYKVNADGKILINETCESFAGKDFIMRTGGSKGCESLWEQCFDGDKEVYLPYPLYLKRPLHDEDNTLLVSLSDVDRALLDKSFEHCNKACHSFLNARKNAKLELASKVFMLLGHDLEEPCDMLLYWNDNNAITKEGGGINFVVRLANMFGIKTLHI